MDDGGDMMLLDEFGEDFAVINSKGEKVRDIKAVFRKDNRLFGVGDYIAAYSGDIMRGYVVNRKSDGTFYHVGEELQRPPKSRVSMHVVKKIYMADKEQSEKLRNADKEIRCTCGKVLLKITQDGKIEAWCKRCKKPVVIELDRGEDAKV